MLARSDNEVEKDGRELKTQLWKKLAIELNEIGPPVRAWMAWKRVLTDYKYSLKKKIQRRIANTSQGGSEILASLSDLETEALQASLLDWDFSDDKVQLSDTPPVDDAHMQQQSLDDSDLLTPSDGQKANGTTDPVQLVNGNPANTEVLNGQIANGNIENLTPQIPVNSELVKLGEDDPMIDKNTPNGTTHMQLTNQPIDNMPLSQLSQENFVQLQPVPITNLPINGGSYIKIDADGTTQEIQQIPSLDQNIGNQPEIPLPPPPVVVTSVPEMTSTTSLNTVPLNTPQTIEQPEMPNHNQPSLPPPPPPPQTQPNPEMVQQQQQGQQQQQLQQQLQGQQQQPGQQQLQGQQQQQGQQQSLSSEEMNILIAREIDRMASAQKVRKQGQRKRETRDRSKASQEGTSQEQKPQQPQAPQPPKEKVRRSASSDQGDRPKRAPQKRPRPRPKETSSASAAAVASTSSGSRNAKRVISGREFRYCLLQLLTEANEMEKRRIAITETKVRNQTEIQNLEITRMNLEIMKLQKEITLLDHGAKILP